VIQDERGRGFRPAPEWFFGQPEMSYPFIYQGTISSDELKCYHPVDMSRISELAIPMVTWQVFNTNEKHSKLSAGKSRRAKNEVIFTGRK
jgi:hypothetical protein